jgi:hypothetical protein
VGGTLQGEQVEATVVVYPADLDEEDQRTPDTLIQELVLQSNDDESGLIEVT